MRKTIITYVSNIHGYSAKSKGSSMFYNFSNCHINLVVRLSSPYAVASGEWRLCVLQFTPGDFECEEEL